MIGKLEERDFDKWLSQSEIAAQEEAIASNEAFVLAMAKAVSRGREKVKPGTFVDPTPPIGAKRLRGSFPISGCGSPAAMCLESAVPENGTTAMMK